MELIIKESKTGQGSFAPRDIKKGEIILQSSGESYTDKEIDNLIDADKMRPDDPLQIGDDEWLELNKESYIVNHSCDPNAGLRKKGELFALRDIKEGEEITYDYSATVPIGNDWTMDCFCGSEKCRKVIGNITSIPKEQMDFYKAEGNFLDFIKTYL